MHNRCIFHYIISGQGGIVRTHEVQNDGARLAGQLPHTPPVSICVCMCMHSVAGPTVLTRVRTLNLMVGWASTFPLDLQSVPDAV